MVTLRILQVVPYPPGIPVLIRGEEITEEHLQLLCRLSYGSEDDADVTVDVKKFALGSGCTVTGWSDPSKNTIKVYKSSLR